MIKQTNANILLFILITEVSKSDGPQHHAKKEYGACCFRQILSITDEVPLKKQIAATPRFMQTVVLGL